MYLEVVWEIVSKPFEVCHAEKELSELTDSLHKTFGFRTDYEFVTKASMRTIIKEMKQIKSKKS